MKFGKSLSNQIDETLPEWRDKFLSYKDLKKTLKLVDPKGVEARPNKRRRTDSSTGHCVDDGIKVIGSGGGDGMSTEEIDFIRLLEDELEKFNSFFAEKEEEYVIILKELQDRVAKTMDSTEEIIKMRKAIVDFHGEMILLENYSALNYTGLVKILKKYEKRTGALIRLPFIQKVLQQPFFTTELVYKLVKECETMLYSLFPSNIEAVNGNEEHGCSTSEVAEENETLVRIIRKEVAEIEYVESLHMKSTISALRGLKEIRSGSSTVSVFSLPPLQISGLEDENWNSIPILEQAAK